MKKFIANTVIFLIPLIVFLSPSFLLFYFSGEFFRDIKTLNRANDNKQFQIGYMRAQENYKRIKLEKVLNNNSYDVWALGSSRVLQFREQMFSSSFYNLGYMISPISDVKVLLKTIPKEKLPKVIILGLDQWMFNEAWVNGAGLKNQKFWEESFRFFPNMRDVEHVYSKIFNGEIRYFETLKKAINSQYKYGLHALVKNFGIISDGSMNWGETIEFLVNTKNIDYSLEFEDTINRIKNGNKRFEYGENPRQESFAELFEVSDSLKKNNVELITFFTPLPKIVYDKINAAYPRYNYINKSAERLNNLFTTYGFEFWDYSNPSTIKSNNDEFYDGLHAGDLTHAKILLNMMENSSTIKKYINYDSLKNVIKNTKKNKLIIYD
tara:strand:+ start:347 stop:1486 length:1140 start_codon:yes stop_codon:yes gene_type:complete